MGQSSRLHRDRCSSQGGFTLTGLALGTFALVAASVAALQLAPAGLQSRLRNRSESSAAMLAQRELDQMLAQPVSSASFTDADGRTILLADATEPGRAAGGPLTTRDGTMQIDFSAAPVQGYHFTYVKPNDPKPLPDDVRWAVIVQTAGGSLLSKQFIVCVGRPDPQRVASPVCIEGRVQQ